MTTARYTADQNGLAERYNRTILERIVAMLADAKLNDTWWAEAAVTANYVTNRVPQRGKETTPYEAFHGKRPDVGHLRVFGCRAWAYNPAEVRRKMQPRAKQGVFMGYGRNKMGYRARVEGKVITSRDVHFDKSPTPTTTTPKTVHPNDNKDASGNEPAELPHVPPEAPTIERRSPGDADTLVVPGGEHDKGDPAGINDAIAAAEQLVREAAAAREADRATSGDEGGGPDAAINDEDKSGGSDEKDECAPTQSRHPARLLRANPARKRPYATRAWSVTRMQSVAWALATSGGSPDKMRMDQAKREPDWPEFDKATRAEVEALHANGTWRLVTRKPGMKITPTTMLCERKRGTTSEVVRYKGRYVVRGDKQEYLVDCLECFAPVARHTTLRVPRAVAAAKGMVIEQLDIETAFLNGDVEKIIYIEQPRGYERGDRTMVCKLLKSLYGLKQAARQWHIELAGVIKEAGFAPCASDPCLFKGVRGGKEVFTLVYVDDLLVVADTVEAAAVGKESITKTFKARQMGEPTFFLGLHLDRDREEGTIKVGQRQYVANLLERFGLTAANTVHLPLGTDVQLVKAGTLLSPEDHKTYQELVGGFLYLATCNRPDISLVVGRLSRFMFSPTAAHLAAAKRVLRYLKGTATMALTYGMAAAATGYHDADFAGDADTRRCTTGYVFMLNGAAVSWLSKRQSLFTLSTTEAEYVAGATAAHEAVWLRTLIHDLTGSSTPMEMRCDNESAISMMHNTVSSARTKHIAIRYHYVRELVEDKTLTVTHVPTGDMIADSLTKALPRDAFAACRRKMGLRPAL